MSHVRITHGERNPVTDEPGCLIRSPYNLGFVTELKSDIPWPHRVWLDDEKAWWVSEEWAEQATEMAAWHYGEVVVNREDGSEEWLGPKGPVARQEGLF